MCNYLSHDETLWSSEFVPYFKKIDMMLVILRIKDAFKFVPKKDAFKFTFKFM
jgi:hypothetical protein